MPIPKEISPTELLNELLETAAQSGDAGKVAELESIIGKWFLRKFMPEVADTAQHLKSTLQKPKDPVGVVNMFNGPVSQAMGLVDRVETQKLE